MLLGPMPTPIPYRDAVKAGWTSRPPVAATPRPRPDVIIRDPDTRAQSPRAAAAPPAAPRSPALAFGVALRFYRTFRPECVDRDGRPIPTRGVALTNSSFDRCLMRAAAGLHTIRLLIGHDHSKEVCNTAQRCLVLEAHPVELQIWIDGTTRSGRLAVETLALFPNHRQVSIGAYPNPSSRINLDNGASLYTEAELEEISLVEDAACEGTWFKVF